MSDSPERPPTEVSRPLMISAIVAAVMLLAALLDIWPYGYFILLRWVVCAVSVFLAFGAWARGRRIVLVVFGALIALLFNPIAPVEFDREVWMAIGVGTAAVMVVRGLLLRQRRAQP